MSLNQSEYSVGENGYSVMGNITLSKIASENLTLECIITDDLANGKVIINLREHWLKASSFLLSANVCMYMVYVHACLCVFIIYKHHGYK